MAKKNKGKNKYKENKKKEPNKLALGKYTDNFECLKNGEYNDYFKSLDNKDVRVTVEAERSFMRELNGGCHSLIGAYATIEGNDLYIIGTYEVNGVIVKKDILGNKEDNIELGKKLAQKILMGQ